MRIRSVRIRGFKRFTDLTIDGIPRTARLVVLVGPNGSGKSSLFDAFKVWHSQHGDPQGSFDDVYHVKAGSPRIERAEHVNVQFHDPPFSPNDDARKMFYIRSAYRNQPDLNVSKLSRRGTLLDYPRAPRMIDNETMVDANYQILVAQVIDDIHTEQYDHLTGEEIRTRLWQPIADAMSRVFGGLELRDLGKPLEGGSFFFRRGTSDRFHYKNLSAGEKAAFDLLLDMVVKRQVYDDTVFCVDEPEGHMHTRIQGSLLDELVRLAGERSQLWIATHSIGMMRKALDLRRAAPDAVVFLDFDKLDFDSAVAVRPAPVDRQFWKKAIQIALDDVAELVAPKEVVLCEGRSGDGPRNEFDARCYRRIFSATHPDVEFISAGCSGEIERDRLQLGSAINVIAPATRVIRLIDRDGKSEQEVEDLKREGVRVLTRRHLEAYLVDDDVLRALCRSQNQDEKLAEVLKAKEAAVALSTGRGNAADDAKSAAGHLFTEVRRLLGLTLCGSTTDAFLRDTLAPLLAPGIEPYEQLEADVFGDGS